MSNNDRSEEANDNPFEFIRSLTNQAEQEPERSDIFCMFRLPDPGNYEDESKGEYHVLAMCDTDTCMNAVQMALTLIGRSVLSDQGVTPKDFKKYEDMDSAAYLVGMKAMAQRGLEWAEQLAMHNEADAAAEKNEAGGNHYSETVEDAAGTKESAVKPSTPTHKGDDTLH